MDNEFFFSRKVLWKPTPAFKLNTTDSILVTVSEPEYNIIVILFLSRNLFQENIWKLLGSNRPVRFTVVSPYFPVSVSNI